SLRQLLAGGDVLPLAQTLRAARELAPTRIINGYGPTESTTFACCHTVDPHANYGRSIPIGTAIAHTSVFILDENFAPAESGEIYIGGDGLARGYWRRPGLDAERFISNPFAPGERLYKTGDLARRLPDGNIEFLGRADHQVKINGYRIETAEIEAALNQHPGVRSSLVIARDAGHGKELIGYVVGDP